MIGRIIGLGFAWVALMALAGGEFLISGLRMPLPNRPLILLPAGVMVLIVVFVFMRLGRAPLIARRLCRRSDILADTAAGSWQHGRADADSLVGAGLQPTFIRSMAVDYI